MSFFFQMVIFSWLVNLIRQFWKCPFTVAVSEPWSATAFPVSVIENAWNWQDVQDSNASISGPAPCLYEHLVDVSIVIST